jgi:hypothetical protein
MVSNKDNWTSGGSLTRDFPHFHESPCIILRDVKVMNELSLARPDQQ